MCTSYELIARCYIYLLCLLFILFFLFYFFFFNDPAPTDIYTLSLHDALPISPRIVRSGLELPPLGSNQDSPDQSAGRSEEHTSELQSHSDLVCRLLLEKKKKNETNQPLYSSPSAYPTQTT